MFDPYRYRMITTSDKDALCKILEEVTGGVSQKKIDELMRETLINKNSICGAVTDNNEVVAFGCVVLRDGKEQKREHYLSNAIELSDAKTVEQKMYKYILDNQEKPPTDKEVTATINANAKKLKDDKFRY